jgi:regulatory protein
MEVAARYLGARPRTRWELERRLHRTGADEAVVERTIERLAALGYVDDRAFARWWAEQRDRHAPRGRRMVEAELRQHGVPREIIEELRGDELAEPALDHHGLPRSEGERALAALDRHLRGRPIPEDRKALERIGMYLVRRGFDPETARRAIRTRAETPREPA